MKPQKTVIAFVIFALLAAYYYFVEIKKKKSDELKKANQEKLYPDFKTESVTKISVKNSSGSILAARGADGWQLESPIKVPADDTVINDVLKDFAGAKIQRKIENPIRQDYGFEEKGGALIEFYADKTYTAEFGADNPTESYVYAFAGGVNDCLILENNLKAHAEKKVFDFRHKGLFKVKEDDIEKIEVSVKGKKYTLERRGADWFAGEPYNARVKKEKAGAIISGMTNSRAKYFEDDKDAAKFGLVSPSEKVVFTTKQGKKTAYFGITDSVKASVFAKSEGVSGIFELPDYIYLNIPKPEEIISRQIAAIDEDSADRVAIAYGGRAIEGARQKDKNWKTISAKGFTNKEKKGINTGAVLSSIRWAEYKEKLPAGAGEKIIAGKPPVLTITMKKEGVQDIMLVYYAGADSNIYYVKNGNDVFTVSGALLSGFGLPGLEIN
ncbi:MAG TPA: DUF4340 domain-containing protein [Candidatus Goldiibacteriota bacterium]|mgnify:FL=1|nr:DUF4340 domain-containing protein [Candidatus Goldiibacteriota bacterium]